MVRVSVIMPCLNEVKYIEACMESVICQTLQEIEILVVDAGSVDGTLEILMEYEKKDSRIRVIHSETKSYGYQMNQGIAQALGEYIGIVETDDIVQKDMLALLYEQAVYEQADYVKGTGEGFYQSTDGIEWRYPIVPCSDLTGKRVVCPKEMPELFIQDNFLWTGIYRKEFLQKIRFNETAGAAFQDIGALFQIVSCAEKGVYINYLVYNYRQDNASASSYNRKSFSYVAEEYRYIEQFVSKLSQEWKAKYYLKMVACSLDRLCFMANSGKYWQESESGIEELHNKMLYAVECGIVNSENCPEWEMLQLFLQNPYASFCFLRDEYEIKVSKIRSLLKILKGYKVCIFGAGKYGKFLHVCLDINGIKTIAYCDNDKDKRKKLIQKIPVLAPEDLVLKEPDAYYVIAGAKRCLREMSEQLIKLGVKEEKIVFYNEGTDIFFLKEFEKTSENQV